jgi:hypothetical protein
MQKQINMWSFMSMMCMLINIKFNIYNDELLILIWKHNKKENCPWYCLATWVDASTKYLQIIYQLSYNGDNWTKFLKR